MRSIEIRPLQDKDIEALVELLKEFALFQKHPDSMTNTVEQLRQDLEHFRCYVALADSSIVGYTIYYSAYSSWSGKSLYIEDLYVTAEFRIMGIGKQLLDTIIQEAKATQCKKVKWQVSKWNKHAQEFYRHMGANMDDTEINCDLNIS